MTTKNIGLLISKRRKEVGIGQLELSEIIGISPKTLRHIEQGIANPELETLQKILTALGLEIKIEVIK